MISHPIHYPTILCIQKYHMDRIVQMSKCQNVKMSVYLWHYKKENTGLLSSAMTTEWLLFFLEWAQPCCSILAVQHMEGVVAHYRADSNEWEQHMSNMWQLSLSCLWHCQTIVKDENDWLRQCQTVVLECKVSLWHCQTIVTLDTDTLWQWQTFLSQCLSVSVVTWLSRGNVCLWGEKDKRQISNHWSATRKQFQLWVSR